MIMRRVKYATCRHCGKGLWRNIAPIPSPVPHVCTPVLSVEEEARAARDLAVAVAPLASYRRNYNAYLRGL